MASDVGCDYLAPAVFAFLRDDGRRSESVQGRSQAVEIPGYQLAASARAARLAQEPASPGSLENRPLVTTLRI